MYKLAPYYYAGTGKDFYVLFEKGTNKALNFSATEHGLTWTTSMDGNLIYYTNGKIKITDTHCYIIPREGKELIKSDNIYVKRFNYSETPNIQFFV